MGTARQIPPDLLQDFESLLTTWPLHIERVMDVRPKDITEADYGDGHYQERRELLQACLRLLSRRPQTNLQAAFKILVGARGRRNIKKLDRAKQSRYQTIYVETGLAKRHAAEDALFAWRTWILTYDPIAKDMAKKRIERIDRVLEDLHAFNPDPRTLKPVRPKDSETEELGRELARAGVPRGFKGSKAVLQLCAAGPGNLQTALLMAVGLIPYRSR